MDSAFLKEAIAEDALKGDEKRLALSQGGDNLVTFIKNFFIQFFHEGFGFVITGFNLDMLLNLEQFFRRRMFSGPDKAAKPEPPNNMMDAVDEYLRINRDVMAGPYTQESRPLKQLYCDFLPMLFKAFEADGKSCVENYDDLMKKINEALTVIARVCAPKKV